MLNVGVLVMSTNSHNIMDNDERIDHSQGGNKRVELIAVGGAICHKV
jgi:hypothetical protein